MTVLENFLKKIKMKKILLILILFITNNVLAEWTWVASSTISNTYIDLKTVKKTGRTQKEH